MLTRHSFKVLLGFCGVILIGLISLVFMDSLKTKDTNSGSVTTSRVNSNITVKLPITKTHK